MQAFVIRFIFFFKQKTAYEMRISDWSSDVCSSDLSSLGETISDAIVLRNDRPAVSALLANGSAQIREETLDRLIEASVQETAWQPALVARPVLPAGAVRKLAGFVADSRRPKLQSRSGRDAHTAKAARPAGRRGGKVGSVRVDLGGRRRHKKK